MLDAMEKDVTERFAGKTVLIQIAHTCGMEDAEKWKAEVQARFPDADIYMDRLSLSVSCHIGPGAMAVACTKVLDI